MAGTDRYDWARALVARFGPAGAANRLGLAEPDIKDIACARPAMPLSAHVEAAIDALIAEKPGIVKPLVKQVYTDPRSPTTIPLTPYPDEIKFFGPPMAIMASKWRHYRERALRLSRDEPGTPDALEATEDLLAIEIRLLRKHGMTLAGERLHSQAVSAPTIKLREQWEWREREIDSVRAARKEAVAKMKGNPIRRFLRTLTKRTK